MVAGRGKTGAAKPSYAGKNLTYYKGKKSSKSRRYDNEEEEEDDEEDFSSEGDNEEESEAESDATVDYAPASLLKKSDSDEEEDDDDEGDDDDDDDDDDEDDESGSSTDEETIESRIKTPVRPKLQVPKKLDVSSIRKQRFGTPSGSESPIKRESEEDNNDIDGDETDSNDFDPSEVAVESSSEAEDMITPVKKRRATSVVEHDFDDRLAFPRSNVFDNMEGYGEYDNQTLLAMLGDHQAQSANEYEEEQDYDIDSHNELGSLADDDDEEDDEDDDEDDGRYDYNDLLNDDEDDDEDKLEDTEAKAIVDEMKDKDLFSNASSPGLLYDTEEFAGFEDDEEEEEEDIMYVIDDFFEPVNLMPKQTPIAPFDEEDDSYLYSYFWTSGSEAENDGHMSAPEIINQDDSGEETEDELPRGGHRKSITRATEVLSSSNSASRPPTLGVWVMNSKRPFGIIDGLNTRSLSPPLSTRQRLQEQEHRRKPISVTPSRKRGWSQTIRSDDSEMSEIALDELIYMSELDEPEDCIGFDLNATPLAQYSQQNTPVPLSAFRNRGIMSAPAHHFDARRSSISNGSRRREITMTPVKSLPRKLKMRKKPKRKLHHDHIDNDLHDDHDHWNDMELGTLSPLFGGIS